MTDEEREDIAQVRAEIKRLRAQRVLSNEDFARSFDMGLAAGEKRERAAVVAWLREVAATLNRSGDRCGGRIEAIANTFDRGEHRREETK